MEYFAGIDVSLEFSSVCYKATLAVGVQDPRRGDFDPQVVAVLGIVQRMQRLAGALWRDTNDRWLAASSDHGGAFPTPGRRRTTLSAHHEQEGVSAGEFQSKERVMLERQATINTMREPAKRVLAVRR